VKNESFAVDRFVGSSAVQLVAFFWGLAEATVFFIVPDVLLSVISCRSVRAGWKAILSTVVGAILGGFIMYGFGYTDPVTSHNLLLHVPAIHTSLTERVHAQMSSHPNTAVLAGPLIGVPYKIYAVEAGTQRNGLFGFLLISIPARGFRFVLTMLVASGIARIIAPWTKRSVSIELGILSVFWIGFYTFYFLHFGW
jgi:membrane protein YqaA with SNARE-associated domain